MKTRIFNISDITPAQLSTAAKAIAAGAVAVFPTDTVYGIGTQAFNEGAIQTIYQLKNRPAASALQILTGTVEQVRMVAVWPQSAQLLAEKFWPGALTLILPASEKGRPLLRGFAGLGLRVPGNAFLVRLLCAMGAPMASTSANLHGQPVLTQEKDILETFDGKVDFIFLSGTLSPVASSVLDLTGKPLLLREEAVSRADLEAVLGGTIL